MFCGVPLGIVDEPRVVAYADDVSVLISGMEGAEEVILVMKQYAEASGSKINQDNSESNPIKIYLVLCFYMSALSVLFSSITLCMDQLFLSTVIGKQAKPHQD